VYRAPIAVRPRRGAPTIPQAAPWRPAVLSGAAGGYDFATRRRGGLCERRPGLILPGKRRATRRATIDVAVVSVRETAARFGGGGIWNVYDDWKPEFPAPSPAGFTSARFVSLPGRIATGKGAFCASDQVCVSAAEGVFSNTAKQSPRCRSASNPSTAVDNQSQAATTAGTPGGSRYAIAARTTLRPSICTVPRVVEQLVQNLRGLI